MKIIHQHKALELLDFIDQKARKPFVWGENDCALFAGLMVKKFHNVQLVSQFYKKYKTPSSALIRLTREGYNSLREILSKNASVFEVTSQPAIGDVALLKYDDGFFGYALGVCAGTFSYFLSPSYGLIVVSSKNCEVWRVKECRQ